MTEHNNDFQTLIYRVEKNVVARITLNRPDIHNAFNDAMLSELTECFKILQKAKGLIRVVVLTGNGKSFCAGADLNWLKKMIHYTYQENLEDSNRLAECMHLLYTLPQPTIARVNGASIGGGMGLVSACDIAIAQENAVFSLSEVKLGLVPACISPYVLKRAGESRCRELFLTGERIDAHRAKEYGLLNKVVAIDKLDEEVDNMVNKFLENGPEALATCKRLLANVSEMSLNEAIPYTAEEIAKLRVSEEGQEGMNAFLQKRDPKWRNK